MANKLTLDMPEQEVVDLFMETLIEFVNRFEEEVTEKCLGYNLGKRIEARFSTETYGENEFYMDYSCIYPAYSKENAKRALELFNQYASLLTVYCEILQAKYPEIKYTIEKTAVSSARIGKELWVTGLPFKLPKLYYTTEEDY